MEMLVATSVWWFEHPCHLEKEMPSVFHCMMVYLDVAIWLVEIKYTSTINDEFCLIAIELPPAR